MVHPREQSEYECISIEFREQSDFDTGRVESSLFSLANPYHVMSCYIHCSRTACVWSCPFNSLPIGRPSEVAVTLQAHVFVVILKYTKVGHGTCTNTISELTPTPN